MKCQFCNNPADRRFGTKSPMCNDQPCWQKYSEAKRALNAEALKDPRVAAIRADKAVGEGTCSSIDECYEHHELVLHLDAEKITDPVEAVKWAREVDGLHWESGLNQMSGEPETDDPIREMHEESKRRNNLPIEV